MTLDSLYMRFFAASCLAILLSGVSFANDEATTYFDRRIYTLVVDGKQSEALRILTHEHQMSKLDSPEYIRKIEANIKNSGPRYIIEFDDASLEQRVRSLIQKREGDIYNHHVNYIEKLNLYGADIFTLSDLKHFTNVRSLDISRTDIQGFRLKSLSELKYLETLIADETKIKGKLDSISSLTTLKTLSLANNSIYRIGPLASLINLEHLNLGLRETHEYHPHVINYISDLSPLSNLTKLKSLNLEENVVEDLMPIRTLIQLEELNLEDNEVVDISPLAKLSQLRELNLSHNKIQTIAPLMDLPKLETLTIRDNLVGNFKEITAFSELDSFIYISNPATNSEVQDAVKENNLAKIKEILWREFRIRDESTVDSVIDHVLAGFSNRASDPGNEVVIFPNHNAEFRVRKALNKPDGLIYGDELAAIIELDLSTNLPVNGMRNADFLKYCINIEELNLVNNPLESLEPLRGLVYLKELELSNTEPLANSRIDTNGRYDPLSALVSVEKLTLNYNKVPDLSFVAGMKNLKILYVNSKEDNKGILSDVSGVELATRLTTVHLQNNIIRDATELLAHSNLNELDLEGNAIKKITTQDRQLNLKILNLVKNNLTSISFVKNLPNLEELYLDDNDIKDISVLKNNVKIYTLELDNNNVSDIESLAYLTELNELSLSNNNVQDASSLSELIKLSTLGLSDNKITDLSFLAKLKELHSLGLSNNLNLNNTHALKNLTYLIDLSMNNSGIKDMNFVVNMEYLKFLILNDNQIEDLSPVRNLERLSELQLQNNNVTGRGMLNFVEHINTVNLEGNPM